MSPTRKPSVHEVVSDDLNFKVWSALMITTLAKKGLWEVVENGIPPDPSKNLELAATLQIEQLCKWRELVRKDMKALQILQSGLTDSVFKRTLSATSAKDLWDMLEQVLPEHESFANYFGDENMWMVHTSTTNHMTPYEKYFTTLDRTRRARVGFLNGSCRIAQGTGDVRFLTKENKTVTIKNVLFVPGLAANVLSVDQMSRSGFSLEMGPKRCTLRDRTNGRLLIENMKEESGHYLRLRVIDGYLNS